MRHSDGTARSGAWDAVDASAVLGVPSLRAALLDDLPHGDAEEGRGARRRGCSGRRPCRLVMPLWRSHRSASDDYPYPPDDEDDDEVEDDGDDEDEDDDEEAPEWQLAGRVSKDSTPGFSANSPA